MEKLKANRKQVRRLFTRACNDFDKEESLLENEDKISKLKLIESKAKLMLAAEEEVKQALLIECDNEEELDKEIDESENYIDRWRLLEIKLIGLLQLPKESSLVDGNMNASYSTLLHYPKIKLPTFDGNVKNWLAFWGQFQKIDKDPNLDDHDKFSYLAQAMEKGSTADELIKSFPPGGESYNKAVKHLVNRFGREEFLIQVYVRELLSLVLQKQNANKKNSLLKLYDQLEAKLRALETLGVTRNKYAAMLYPLVESSLPDETLRAWERVRCARRRSKIETEEDNNENDSSKSMSNSDLDNLLCFLQDEVEGEERVSLAVKGFETNFRSSHNIKRENFRLKEHLSILRLSRPL